MFEQMLSLGYEMEISENKNYGMKGVTVGNTCSAGDKLKLLLRSALKVLLVGFFSSYPSDLFLSHRGGNHQFIAFSKHMYIQYCHTALLFRKVKYTALYWTKLPWELL